MTVWGAVSTGLRGGFVALKGSERVGEISLGDDELGFEVGMENELTATQREKRLKEVEK